MILVRAVPEKNINSAVGAKARLRNARFQEWRKIFSILAPHKRYFLYAKARLRNAQQIL